MRKSHRLGHAARIMDVTPRAAGTLLRQRSAVIVELKRDAHDIIAFFGQLGGHDGAVDAAGHGDDDARVARRLGEAKGVHRLFEGHDRSSVWRGGAPAKSAAI